MPLKYKEDGRTCGRVAHSASAAAVNHEDNLGDAIRGATTPAYARPTGSSSSIEELRAN
jgi:hypothetical protein